MHAPSYAVLPTTSSCDEQPGCPLAFRDDRRISQFAVSRFAQLTDGYDRRLSRAHDGTGRRVVEPVTVADNNDVLEAIVGLKKLLDVIGTQTGQTELDIRAMEGDMREIKGDIREMKGDIREMKGDISQLKSDVRRLDEKTDRIETKLGRHETRIEVLEVRP